MKLLQLSIAAGVLLLSALAAPAQAQHAPEPGAESYARIAVLRPHDGDTVDFEAGYIRHLEWHRQVRDSWVWYGWNIWASDRQRSLVYASFGHTAASIGNPVQPAEDERDNISNVTPHASYVGNAIYEYLPRQSRGTGVPTPTARADFTTVNLEPGADDAFEAALASRQSSLRGETLWFRMVAGGQAPRYVRLRPRRNLAEILDSRRDLDLPSEVDAMVTSTTVEILNLRPTLSYGLPANLP